MQGNLSKLSAIVREIRRVAEEQGLKPSETVYRKWGKGPKRPLRFSKHGEAHVERAYATHWVSRRDRSPRPADATGEEASAEARIGHEEEGSITGAHAEHPPARRADRARPGPRPGAGRGRGKARRERDPARVPEVGLPVAPARRSALPPARRGGGGRDRLQGVRGLLQAGQPRPQLEGCRTAGPPPAGAQPGAPGFAPAKRSKTVSPSTGFRVPSSTGSDARAMRTGPRTAAPIRICTRRT